MIWMMAKLGKEAGLVAPKALITILIAYLTFRYEMLMFTRWQCCVCCIFSFWPTT